MTLNVKRIFTLEFSVRHSRNFLIVNYPLLKMFLYQESIQVRWYLLKMWGGTIRVSKIAHKFFGLLDLVLAGKVKRVLLPLRIEYRMEFELFSYLFAKFGCEIITISEEGFTKIDDRSFEEIVDLLRLYHKTRCVSHKSEVKELFGDDDYTTS